MLLLMLKLFLTVTFVFSSNKIDVESIDQIYILIAFTKPKYKNFSFYLFSAIIFH